MKLVMNEHHPNSKHRFIKLALMLAVCLTLTNCRTCSKKPGTDGPEATPTANNGGVQPAVTPSPGPTESPSPPEKEEAKKPDTPPESSEDRFTAFAKGRAAEAWVIPFRGQKNPIGERQVQSNSQVGTNNKGWATVRIEPNCGIFNIFHDTNLRFSRCKVATIKSGGACLEDGAFSFGSISRNCQKNRIRMGTEGLEIELAARNELNHQAQIFKNTGFINFPSQLQSIDFSERGDTDFDLFYFPSLKASVVHVRLGRISVLPIGDDLDGDTLTQNKCYLTQSGEVAAVARVEQRTPFACEANIIRLLLELARRENSLTVTTDNIQLATELALRKRIPLLPSEQHAVLKVYPNPLKFDSQTVGQQVVKSLLIENRGIREAINISKPTISGVNQLDFELVKDACSTHSFDDKCELQIGFTPRDGQFREAQLSIKDTAANNNVNVGLVGFGLKPTVLIIDRPASDPLFPGSHKVGKSVTKPLTIKNTGMVNVNIDKVSFADTSTTAFTYTNKCTEELPPNGTCVVEVTFTPLSEAQYSASLLIGATEVHPVGPEVRTLTLPIVTLRGTGARPAIKLNKTELCFSEQIAVKKKSERVLIVTNPGTVSLSVGKASVTSGDFTIVEDTCSHKEVGPGSECHVTVGFAPSKSGLREGKLTIAHDKEKAAVSVISLKGVGKSNNGFIRFFESIFKRTKNPCKKG